MTTRSRAPEVGTWEWMATQTAVHGKTKIDNNTHLQRDTDVTGDHILYTIVLHDTAILVFDGKRQTIELNSGGYLTALTQRRMNTYLRPHGYRIENLGGTWFLVNPGAERTRFYDGMDVSA